MTSVAELDTPAVTVDLDKVGRNIRRAQDHLAALGLANRPHIKTHKIPALAKLQMDAGAVGITCQKLGEVEVMADAGVADDNGAIGGRSASWRRHPLSCRMRYRLRPQRRAEPAGRLGPGAVGDEDAPHAV
jgi:hypothetical protein